MGVWEWTRSESDQHKQEGRRSRCLRTTKLCGTGLREIVGVILGRTDLMALGRELSVLEESVGYISPSWCWIAHVGNGERVVMDDPQVYGLGH